MASPIEYRARAAAARLAAEQALTPELRASLLRVEATWLALAATAELVVTEPAPEGADTLAEAALRPDTARNGD